MINVVTVIGQLGVGGGERQLYLFIKNLDTSRFHPLVVTLNPDHGDYWEQPIRDLGVELRGIRRTWNKVERAGELARILRETKAQIVHSWDFRRNWLVAMAGKMAGTPVRIGSVRSNLYKEGRSEIYRRHGIIGLSCFIANSSQGRNHLIRLGIKLERIHLIHNAVEPLGKPKMSLDQRSAIRSLWGARDDDIVIAAVGQLIEAKNYPLLIQATSALLQAGHKVLTIVYGDGPERRMLYGLVAKLGLQDKFLFLGQDVRARLLIAAADIYCLPSLREGMPNVLLEACAAGLPSVATDVGGVRDVLESGVSGFIVPANDQGALVKHLSQLIDHSRLRLEMGALAHERIRSVFGVAKITNDFQDCYQKALLCQN